MKQRTLFNQGFTLVEMMVAVSLFVVVAFIITSAFTVFAEANRRSQAIRISIDNLNFAMESIVLKMREGNHYNCDESLNDTGIRLNQGIVDCPSNPSDFVSFLADNGNIIKYLWEDDTIYGCEYDPDNGRCGLIPIVAPEVKVERLNFYVKNGDRPLVQIIIEGTIDTTAGSRKFNLQTSVSQRP